MNYSTLKKTVALSFVAAMGFGVANAQTTMSASGTSTPKVFGGIGQYNTWSIGFNVGVTSPVLVTGGSEDFLNFNIRPAVGVSLRKQLSHTFGLQWDVQYGRLAGNNVGTSTPNGREGLKGYQTEFGTSSLSGVFNFATIDFLHRKNAVNFFANGGFGLAYYTPKLTPSSTGSPIYFKNPGVAPGNSNHAIFSPSVPVGAGVKFRLSESTALNFGYTETFIGADNFDGNNRGYPGYDHYSYGYGGLEFTLGSKSKPSLEWVNPVALMYDELYDAELRKEVAALKGRVSNVENAVNDLKKDSDGDGVSDQFDKCPNTPAGTVVDGSGCEIHFPAPPAAVAAPAPVAVAYSAIQFDFDSSVLRTSSYPVLDATSAELRSASGSVEVDGFASSEGTAAHNLRLSKDRANSVKTYLVNSGVDAKRVKVKGFGETKPIADNSTEEGRIANRRVEFKK